MLADEIARWLGAAVLGMLVIASAWEIARRGPGRGTAIIILVAIAFMLTMSYVTESRLPYADEIEETPCPAKQWAVC